MKQVTGQKFINSLIWRLLEQYSAQGITLVLTIILTRILNPSDYGIIALTMIFIAFSDILTKDGFIVALVQKKDVEETDYSTAAIISLLVSFTLYFIIFIISPYVSIFYAEESLTKVLRVLTLVIFANAFGAILSAKAVRAMNFKLLFITRVVSSIISGIVGICMALTGYGVWSLVMQILLQQIIYDIILVFSLKWKVIFSYSIEKAKMLTSFGSKITIGSLIAFFSDSIYGVIIGRNYSTKDLGYFNQGDKLPQALVLNVSSAIAGVVLPTLSSYQDDIAMVKNITRRVVRTSCYMIFPLCFGLVVTARSVVTILFTSKWLFSVPILQLLCIFYLTTPILLICSQVFFVIGQSKLKMHLETVKMCITLSTVLILITLFRINIYFFTALKGIISITMVVIVSFFTKKYINYSLMEQMADMGIPFIMSAIMALCVAFIPRAGFNVYVTAIIQVIAGAGIYLLLSLLLKEKGFYDILSIISRSLVTRVHKEN